MKRLAAIALVGAALALATPSARACHPACCAPCVVPCCVQFVEKTVTCYRPEWKTRDVVCTVMRPVPREVVEKYNCTVMVPEWKDEKRTIYICNYVPKEEVREVTCCRMVPVCVTDPCTGCTYTSCKPECYTQKVKCCVLVPASEKRDVVVKVCTYRPEQRTVECRRVVCDYKPEQVTYKQCYCEMVPYQAKVMVPVCCP
jgi:hypothetical protein